MSEHTLFVKRVGLVGAVRLITNLRGLILLPILTKTLEAHGYGIWSLILAGVSLMMPFIMLGLPSAMVRYLSSKSGKQVIAKELFAVLFTILFVSGVFALFVFLSSDFIADTFFKDISATPLIQITSLLIILEALNQASMESFRTFGQIKRYSILILLQTFIEIGLVSLALLSGFGLFGAIMSVIMTRGFILLLSLMLIINHSGFTFPDFTVLHSYLLFGLPLVPSVIFELVVALSDRYLIAFFKDAIAVGIYSASYVLGTTVVFSLGPITYILSPTIFKLYDENKIAEVKTYLSYSLKYFLMFCIPSVLGVSILAKSVLYSLTTPEFVTLGIFIAPLVALSMIFEGMRAIYGEVLMLFKRTKIFGTASIIAGLLNLVLNIALIPYFGIVVAAITTLISYGTLGFIMCYTSRKYMKFELNLSFVMKSVLSSVVMVFAIWVFNPIGVMKILLATGIGAIVYFCVLFLLKGFKKEELEIISETVGLRRIYERLR